MPQNLGAAFIAKTPSGAQVQVAADASNVLQSVNPGAKAKNYSANNAGDQVKTGAGLLQGLTINTGGTTSSATLYDGTSTSGTKLATVATTALGSLTFNIAFTTGLFVVLAGGAAADVTVTYR